MKTINITSGIRQILTFSCDSYIQSRFVHKIICKNQCMLCSNNSVKANFSSNYKKSADVSCFVVHLTFHSYSLLFSRIPSSKNDRQPSYYSEDSNLNSSCSKFVVLQHKNSKYVGKSKIILRLNGLKNTK